MTKYHAYLIGEDGHIKHRIDMVCADDDAAKEHAKFLRDADDRDIELWQSSRKIATFVHKR
jgi:hypothetical protein